MGDRIGRAGIRGQGAVMEEEFSLSQYVTMLRRRWRTVAVVLHGDGAPDDGETLAALHLALLARRRDSPS